MRFIVKTPMLHVNSNSYEGITKWLDSVEKEYIQGEKKSFVLLYLDEAFLRLVANLKAKNLIKYH